MSNIIAFPQQTKLVSQMQHIMNVHITKSNGTKEDREKTLQLLKDSLMILGYALREVKSKYTVRLEEPL